MIERKIVQNKEASKFQTFPIPFGLGEIKENFNINTNSNLSSSKEKLITQALSLHSKGDLRGAAKYYQDFINEGFTDPYVYSNYGVICKQTNQIDLAIKIYNKSIELFPNNPESFCNLGNLLKDIGRLEEAEISTRKAIKIKPDFAEAHSNLGIILKNLGKLKEAEISTLKAIKYKPDVAIYYVNLASIFHYSSKLEEAQSSINKAIKIDPYLAIAHSSLGDILDELGKRKEASYSYEKAHKIDPGNLSYQIKSKLYLSPIPFDQIQIDKERKNFKEQLLIIKNDNRLIYKDEIFKTSSFYLAYHNCSDDVHILKELSRALSNKEGIVNKNFNKKERVLTRNGNKIRLGICSDFLYSHSVCNFFGNIIKDITSSELEVILFRRHNAKEDEITQSIDSLVSEVVRIPDSINDAANLILSKSIDILFYLDIGMSNITYLLSLSRLALVQVTTLGHPNTSGSDEIDYFISCENYETKNSEELYSERVIKLSRIPVNYTLPLTQKSTFNLHKFNLPENSFLIGIAHSPFKFHPDYDLILDKILQEIPNAIFIYADGIESIQTNQLKSRWDKRTNLILKRTIFLPRMKFNDFLELIKLLDIIIDPFYFGMANTFYQAMALNTPVVTMPGIHMKSRHAFAGYKQMCIENAPIAESPEEYIEICKKLAFNKSYLNHIKSQINNKSRSQIFNDKTIYKEYLEFFRSSIYAAEKDTLLPRNWKAQFR